MDFLKKYNSWEIVVALLPPFFALDSCWHQLHDEYPSALYRGVSVVFDFAYLAILLYSLFCMYRGARQSHRFPKSMLLMLISVAALQLYNFVPQPENIFDGYQFTTHYYIWSGIRAALSLFNIVVAIIAIIRMFKEKLTMLAVTYSCLLLVLPLLQTLLFLLIPISLANRLPSLLPIVSQIFSLLLSLCYSVLFLHRNDFYNPTPDTDYHG